ncbi:zf-HC2 domain-containing protein, partial [Candidatus Binatia bacterium]|nr:zf-HC2 domain-containing protein [Candidatus Binatia bacterium]
MLAPRRGAPHGSAVRRSRGPRARLRRRRSRGAAPLPGALRRGRLQLPGEDLRPAARESRRLLRLRLRARPHLRPPQDLRGPRRHPAQDVPRVSRPACAVPRLAAHRPRARDRLAARAGRRRRDRPHARGRARRPGAGRRRRARRRRRRCERAVGFAQPGGAPRPEAAVAARARADPGRPPAAGEAREAEPGGDPDGGGRGAGGPAGSGREGRRAERRAGLGLGLARASSPRAATNVETASSDGGGARLPRPAATGRAGARAPDGDRETQPAARTDARGAQGLQGDHLLQGHRSAQELDGRHRLLADLPHPAAARGAHGRARDGALSHVELLILSQHADGELPAADAHAVAEHLATCPDCRGRLERLHDATAAAARAAHAGQAT